MSSIGTSGVGGATGPRTPEGKARSSLNAVTHGLTAKTPLLPGEDPAEFRESVWAVAEDLAPVGPVEHRLACRAGVLLWKRQRVDEAEREVFDDLRCHYEEEAEDALQKGEEFAETEEDHRECAEARADEEANGAARNARWMLADELSREPGSKVGRFERKMEGRLDRLYRYEQRIDARIDSTLRLLMRLQNRRQQNVRGPRRDGGPFGQEHEQGQAHPGNEGPRDPWQGQLRSTRAAPHQTAETVTTAPPAHARQVPLSAPPGLSYQSWRRSRPRGAGAKRTPHGCPVGPSNRANGAVRVSTRGVIAIF